MNAGNVIFQPIELIHKWIEAYNQHDVNSICSLYHPNSINYQIPYGKVVQGRDAIRIVYEKTFAAFPDIHIEVIQIAENKPCILLEWVFRGTMMGEFAGNRPNLRRFNLQGCEIFKIQKGSILEQRGYWDLRTLYNELNLVSV